MTGSWHGVGCTLVDPARASGERSRWTKGRFRQRAVPTNVFDLCKPAESLMRANSYDVNKAGVGLDVLYNW